MLNGDDLVLYERIIDMLGNTRSGLTIISNFADIKSIYENDFWSSLSMSTTDNNYISQEYHKLIETIALQIEYKITFTIVLPENIHVRFYETGVQIENMKNYIHGDFTEYERKTIESYKILNIV